MGVTRAKGPPLMSYINPIGSKSSLVEMSLGPVQIAFFEDLESHFVGDTRVALFKHYAMMTALLKRAQVDAPVILAGDLQA